MAAYFVACITVKDPSTYDLYRRDVSAIITRYGGRYLVRGGATEVKEGSWPAERTVIIEFSDMATAHAWYFSLEYQAILPLRLNASEGDAIFIEGVSAA